jgi:hypothetical protein
MLGILLLFSGFTPLTFAESIQPRIPSAQATWQSPDQHRLENTHRLGAALIIAGYIGLFVGQIYFIVRAFQTSTTWGVCMLLFGPLTGLFFCLFEFGQARRPLGIFLFSLAAVVGGVRLSVYGM